MASLIPGVHKSESDSRIQMIIICFISLQLTYFIIDECAPLFILKVCLKLMSPLLCCHTQACEKNANQFCFCFCAWSINRDILTSERDGWLVVWDTHQLTRNLCLGSCVLMLLSGCLCTHAAVWVSVYSSCCLGVCVLILLSGCLCTHAAVWVSVYSSCCLGVCVLMLLSGFLCTHPAVWVSVYSSCCLGVCVLMLLSGCLCTHAAGDSAPS